MSLFVFFDSGKFGPFKRQVKHEALISEDESNNGLVEHPEVINGASDMIDTILGESGTHTRIAVGSASLPKNAAVEVSSIIYIK